MERIIRKLRSRSGETLVETLAAIVIVVIAGMTMFYAIMTAARINRITSDADDRYVQESNNAEQLTGDGGSGIVTVSNTAEGFSADFEVIYTGGEDKLTSYIPEGEAAP